MFYCVIQFTFWTCMSFLSTGQGRLPGSTRLCRVNSTMCNKPQISILPTIPVCLVLCYGLASPDSSYRKPGGQAILAAASLDWQAGVVLEAHQELCRGWSVWQGSGPVSHESFVWRESPYGPLNLGLIFLKEAGATNHVCKVTVSGKGCRELGSLVCDSSLWDPMPCKTRPLHCCILVTRFAVPWWPLCILSSISSCALSGMTNLSPFIASLSVCYQQMLVILPVWLLLRWACFLADIICIRAWIDALDSASTVINFYPALFQFDTDLFLWSLGVKRSIPVR